ncbi:MAG: LacI family DNA-binding transcriptional regulator [Chthoniobacteraceae bacterium]
MAVLAQKTGLSISGVSLALRNSPKISAETRARVQKIADQIGYRPNAMVSALMAHIKQGRSAAGSHAGEAIAWLNTSKYKDFWHSRVYNRPFLRGASERAEELGFRLEEFWMWEPRMTARRLQKILTTRRICGLIVTPSFSAFRHLSMEMDLFAMASFQHGVTRPLMHRARADHAANTLETVRRLTKLGYKRLGLFVTADQDRCTEWGVTSVFLRWQHDKPAEACVPIACCDREDNSVVQQAFAKWLKQEKPDAVICVDSRISEFIRNFAPDVAVAHVGMVNEELPVGVCGIDNRSEEIAAAAVDLVVAQLHRNERGLPETPKMVLIPGQWVTGTTAPGKSLNLGLGGTRTARSSSLQPSSA